MDSETMSDETLWQLSLRGDTVAFGRIVERYQSLICALAYSACGNLATSEDLAQETFVAAWRRLGELREPNKLRNWLCGIVRNLAANANRRDFRRGGAPAALEAVGEKEAPTADPAAEAVTHEEEILLWRALASMPEQYREPLVLFYREQQSIAEVATGLDLSADAVKQRLSRGRALLRDELATLVESTLGRSRPKAAFTAAILAALPFGPAPSASAAAATGAVAGKGLAAMAKSALSWTGIGLLTGPVIGFLITLAGSKGAASFARTDLERKCITRYARRIAVFCFAMSVGLAAALSQAGKLYPVSTLGLIAGVCGWVAALVFTVHFWARRMQSEVSRIRAATGTEISGRTNTDTNDETSI
jgi:RNA polymerase sigma factor (sigma-70 family)